MKDRIRHDLLASRVISRRGLLGNAFSGLAGIGLVSLLGKELAAR